MKKILCMTVMAAMLLLQVQPVYAAAKQTDVQEETAGKLSEEELDELLNFVKEKWDAGEFQSEEDIAAAIEEGEKKFGVVLETSEKDQLTKAIRKLDSMGLDHEAAIEAAKKLYRDYGSEIEEKLQGLYEEYGEQLGQKLEEIISEQKDQLTESVEKAVREQVVEPAKEAAKSAVEDTAKGFWSDLKSSVISFFENIFS